jgi:hypothetical protein
MGRVEVCRQVIILCRLITATNDVKSLADKEIEDLVAMDFAPHIPFANVRQSGFGIENGTHGLTEFTALKPVFIPKAKAN